MRERIQPGRAIAALVLLVTAWLPVAEAQAACPVAGSYNLVGRVPGGTQNYKGTADITAYGDGCYMRWYPPNDSEGTGAFANGTLTINFTFAVGGGTGVVRYTLMPNGQMEGVWWMTASPDRQGVETLTRR